MDVDNNLQSNIDWVEFIGPSGVGKSRLYGESVKTRKRVDCWFTVEEALEEVAKTYLYENKINPSFLSLLRNFLKRLSPFHELKFYNLVRNKLRSISEKSLGEKYDFFCELLIQNLDPVNRLAPHKRLSFLSWFYFNRLMDFMVLECFQIGNIVVHEDGILHNNPGIAEKSIDLLIQNTPEETGFNYLPAGIVYCFADDSLILERVKQRNQDGRGTMFQDRMTDDQLIEFIRNDISVNQAKIEFFQKLGTPIISIDTSDDLQKNSRMVNDFIASLKP